MVFPENRMKQPELGVDGFRAGRGICCGVPSQNIPENGHLQCVILLQWRRAVVMSLKNVIILNYYLWHFLSVQSCNLKKIMMELILTSALSHDFRKMSRDRCYDATLLIS